MDRICFRKYELYCKPSKVGEGRYNYEHRVATPNDMYDICKALKMHLLSREKVYAMYLDTAGHLIGVVEIASGGVDFATVDQKVIFGPAMTLGKCAALIQTHNHPSGNLNPSAEDKELTDRVKKAGEILGVKLLDHIVVGENGFYSMREYGMIS